MYDIGVIQKVSISEAIENATNRNLGIVQRTAYPNHSHVLITVQAQARMDGVNYSVNGRTVMVGMPIHFRTPNFVSFGTCIDIREITEITED
jgi:hypothetical protein